MSKFDIHFEIICGENLPKMRSMPDCSVDACVCDPPYGLKFMGKHWDYDVPTVEQWREVFRVLKPGAHLLSFFGTRTYHRGVCAIEDAGFEIRDCIMWVYGSGFPKSLDVSKAIDKAAWAEREVVGEIVRGDVEAAKVNGATIAAADANRNNKAIFGYGVEKLTIPSTDAATQWDGWGTALKPACEPIVVARKPIEGTVAENVLKHGTGAINIDGCRIGTNTETHASSPRHERNGFVKGFVGGTNTEQHSHGRWPANLIHDGSEEVRAAFPDLGKAGQHVGRNRDGEVHNAIYGARKVEAKDAGYSDSGSAARFFYCAKASKQDRNEGLGDNKNHHPTVKTTDLMRYLCRLVTPPGGLIIDPWAGSGSTGKAAVMEGFRFIGIESEESYCRIAEARIRAAIGDQAELF